MMKIFLKNKSTNTKNIYSDKGKKDIYKIAGFIITCNNFYPLNYSKLTVSFD